LVKIHKALNDAKRELLSKLKVKDGEVIGVTEETDCILITTRYPKPEEWRVIPAFPNYETNEKGQVRDRHNKNLIPAGSDYPNPDKDPNAYYVLKHSQSDPAAYLLQRRDIFLSTFPEYLGSGHSF
jgi:hypothetical protein